MFGNWTSNLEKLQEEYLNAKPYEHVVVENFFDIDYCKELVTNFPEIDDKWFLYKNPIEYKYALTDFNNYPIYKNLYKLLQSEQCLDLIKKITGIENLENDHTLHGAGLHYHPKNGKLDMHLDYSIHPLLKKERRVNLIIYLNENWKPEWNGDIQLWDKDFTKCEKKLYPTFNTAIIFKTNDVSYHGLPVPIDCPINTGRKSVAIYYISDITNNMKNIRYKAKFRSLPSQPINDKLQRLYDIRSERRLSVEDLATIYPDWETDGKGYW